MQIIIKTLMFIVDLILVLTISFSLSYKNKTNENKISKDLILLDIKFLKFLLANLYDIMIKSPNIHVFPYLYLYCKEIKVKDKLYICCKYIKSRIINRPTVIFATL